MPAKITTLLNQYKAKYYPPSLHDHDAAKVEKSASDRDAGCHVEHQLEQLDKECDSSSSSEEVKERPDKDKQEAKDGSV